METTWRDKIKSHFPDKEFEDDDTLGGAAGELIDQLKSENGGLAEYKEKNAKANQKLIELFESEPAVADFIADILKGASLPVALARNFDPEDFTPQEGEPDYEEWDKSRNERITKLGDRRKREEELTANKVESSKVFEKFQQEKGMSDDEVDAFAAKLDSFLGDVYDGKVTPEFLETIFKAMSYDSELEATRNAALVEGKNTAIEAKKVEAPKGDGLPRVGTTGEMQDKPTKEPDIFDRANQRYNQRNRYK